MKQSTENVMFIHNKSKLVGINLGFDYCAEHEWGIEDLQESLGIIKDPSVFGLEKRIISDSSSISIAELEDHRLVLYSIHSYNYNLPSIINRYIELSYRSNPKDPIVYWDDSSFLIVASTKSQNYDLKSIYEGIRSNKVILTLARISDLGSGLKLLFLDKIPKLERIKLYEKEKEYYQLNYIDLPKTGIVNKLKKSGKRYFSLRPAYPDKDHSLIFWLNPFDQNLYLSGWFTLKDLEDWANNSGRIIRKK